MNIKMCTDSSGVVWVRYNDVYRAMGYAQLLSSYIPIYRARLSENKDVMESENGRYNFFTQETAIGREYWVTLEELRRRLYSTRGEKRKKAQEILRHLNVLVTNKNMEVLYEHIKPGTALYPRLIEYVLNLPQWSKREVDFVLDAVGAGAVPEEYSQPVFEKILNYLEVSSDENVLVSFAANQ